MPPSIPPEKLPRIVMLLRALELAPGVRLRLGRGRRVSFRSLVRWVRRADPEFYYTLLRVYGCGDDSCLARSMSRVFVSLVKQYLSLEEPPERAGEAYEVLRGGLRGVYPGLEV